MDGNAVTFFRIFGGRLKKRCFIPNNLLSILFIFFKFSRKEVSGIQLADHKFVLAVERAVNVLTGTWNQILAQHSRSSL